MSSRYFPLSLLLRGCWICRASPGWRSVLLSPSRRKGGGGLVQPCDVRGNVLPPLICEFYKLYAFDIMAIFILTAECLVDLTRVLKIFSFFTVDL